MISNYLFLCVHHTDNQVTVGVGRTTTTEEVPQEEGEGEETHMVHLGQSQYTDMIVSLILRVPMLASIKVILRRSSSRR